MAETKSTKVRKNRRTAMVKGLPRGPHGGVQLLLVQTLEPLGKQGDVVEVKPGYARNFLLPQGLATLATDHHRRMVEKHKARLAEIQTARLADLQALADALARQSLTIEANANEEGHLYGSVGPNDIAAVLKRNNFASVTSDMVRLQGPLKELGLYTVKIHLGQEVDAEVKIWVVPAVGEDQPTESK
jgi:large subunit ribosomal protein L9